ncbi:MAG: SPOR domain-containing protein [Desulfamplus sp.]|nr:SPOR domain-containing protein [Desulfamplus sp.]
MGVLVGRGTAPVEFDTGWFQERLAVIFEDAETKEPVLEKPDLDFYAALKKSDLNEDYDLKIRKPSVSKSKDGTATESAELSDSLSEDLAANDLLTPLKKSRKAMTSKLHGKQISSITSMTKSMPDSKGSPIDRTSVNSGSGQKKNSNSDQKQYATTLAPRTEKTADKTAYTTKTPSLMAETKSVQGAEYNNTAYSYTIQIASFPNESDAIKHIETLKAKGYSAYMSSGMVGEYTWYRIRTGSFNNITDAKANLKQLEGSGIKGLIIQKD